MNIKSIKLEKEISLLKAKQEESFLYLGQSTTSSEKNKMKIISNLN